MELPIKKTITVYDLTTTIKSCPYCGCHSSYTKITKCDNDNYYEYYCSMCNGTVLELSLDSVIEKLRKTGYFKCDEYNHIHLCNYNYEDLVDQQ